MGIGFRETSKREQRLQCGAKKKTGQSAKALAELCSMDLDSRFWKVAISKTADSGLPGRASAF